GADRGALPRHPPGGGVSVVPGPHGEGDAVATAGRAAGDGDPPDGELRDVAGGVGERAVLRAPRGALFRRGHADARPGGELRFAQEDAAARGRALAGAEPGIRPGLTCRLRLSNEQSVTP